MRNITFAEKNKVMLNKVWNWLKTDSRLVFFIIFAFTAVHLTEVKIAMTPAWTDGTLVHNHQSLLNFTFTNNEQSRLFQYYVPEFFVRTIGYSIPEAYELQRRLFTFLSFALFFLFARKWLSRELSFLSVMLLAVTMPFTFRNHLQESASLLMVTFLLALWAIREKKDFLFALVLLVGAVNNETMLFLPALYFFDRFERFELKHLIRISAKMFVLIAPAFAVVGYIRYLTRDAPHLGGAYHLPANISMIRFPILIFHVFWVLAYLKMSEKPRFLQRALWSVPLFIIPHMITGIITETRQMLPLSYIIFPAALFFLFGSGAHSDNQSTQKILD